MWAEFIADWNKTQENIKKEEAGEKINFTFISKRVDELRKEKTVMAICAGTLAILAIPFALGGPDKIPFASGIGLTSLIALYQYDQAKNMQKKMQKLLKK